MEKRTVCSLSAFCIQFYEYTNTSHWQWLRFMTLFIKSQKKRRDSIICSWDSFACFNWQHLMWLKIKSLQKCFRSGKSLHTIWKYMRAQKQPRKKKRWVYAMQSALSTSHFRMNRKLGDLSTHESVFIAQKSKAARKKYEPNCQTWKIYQTQYLWLCCAQQFIYAISILSAWVLIVLTLSSLVLFAIAMNRYGNTNIKTTIYSVLPNANKVTLNRLAE